MYNLDYYVKLNDWQRIIEYFHLVNRRAMIYEIKIRIFLIEYL